jgi:hypothetical protein
MSLPRTRPNGVAHTSRRSMKKLSTRLMNTLVLRLLRALPANATYLHDAAARTFWACVRARVRGRVPHACVCARVSVFVCAFCFALARAGPGDAQHAIGRGRGAYSGTLACARARQAEARTHATHPRLHNIFRAPKRCLPAPVGNPERVVRDCGLGDFGCHRWVPVVPAIREQHVHHATAGTRARRQLGNAQQ